MALRGPIAKTPGADEAFPPSSSAAAHAGTANVAVNVGEPAKASTDSKPQLVTWWPVILFALTVAAAAGGLYFEVKDHTRDIDALKQDVKGVQQDVRGVRDEVDVVDRKMDLLLIRQGIDPTVVRAK